MRISDWSSDVCSSDLWPMADAAEHIDADSQQVQHNLDHAAETQAMPHGGPTEGIEASGGTEHHVDPSALGLNGTAWVSLAMLIFLGILLWKKDRKSTRLNSSH